MSENKTYRLADNEALAQARHVRMAPMKSRRMVDLIRGKKADEALTLLRFAPQAAAGLVFKVIHSAMANAENNNQLNPANLWISQAYVDEGATLKRFRPRAQGRAFRINKRTSHITIVVQEREQNAPATRRTKSQTKVSKSADKATTQTSAATRSSKTPTSGTTKDRVKGSTVTAATKAESSDKGGVE